MPGSYGDQRHVPSGISLHVHRGRHPVSQAVPDEAVRPGFWVGCNCGRLGAKFSRGGAGLEITLFGDACGAARRTPVVVAGLFVLARELEQVPAHRVHAVVAGQSGIHLGGGQCFEALAPSLDHGQGNDAVERHHWSGGKALQEVVEPEDLPPIGVLGAFGFVAHRPR